MSNMGPHLLPASPQVWAHFPQMPDRPAYPGVPRRQRGPAPLLGSGSQEAERWEAPPEASPQEPPGWEAVPRAGARPECCRAGWDPEPARPRPFYHWPLPRGPPSRPSRAADGGTDGRTARAARRGGPRSQLQPDCTGVSDHSGGTRRGSRPSSRRGRGQGWTAGSPGDPEAPGRLASPSGSTRALGVGRAWPC